MLFPNLKIARNKVGLTQKDVAQRINITCQQYQLYESGKRELPAHYFIDLAKMFNVSIDYLMELPPIQ